MRLRMLKGRGKKFLRDFLTTHSLWLPTFSSTSLTRFLWERIKHNTLNMRVIPQKSSTAFLERHSAYRKHTYKLKDQQSLVLMERKCLRATTTPFHSLRLTKKS